MEDKENQACPQNSPPSRKRPSESEPDDQTVKKRSVLGELTTNASDDSDLDRSSIVGNSRKLKSDRALKTAEAEVKLELVVTPGFDETQKLRRAPSMYQYLHSLEVEEKQRPLFNYMEKVQKDINPIMRLILVDWLVEVAEEYKLVSDTIYLTVNYVDRYLSTYNLTRNKLQLLGVSCMLIASKHEEITPPHVEDFCYIADNTYSKEEVLQMESDVMKFLNFEMGIPTIKTFIRIFCRAAQEKPMFSDLKFELLCCYIAELSLLDYDCIRYLPSMVAASAIFLARLIIQRTCHPWTQALQHQTGYKPSDLKECVLRLHYLQLHTEKCARAVRKKYTENRFKRVASLSPPSGIPSCIFKVSME